MKRPVLAMWVLGRCEALGTREELVGDLLEEIAQGRSRVWVWQQVLAFLGFDLARRLRHYSPPRGHVIAAAPLLSLLGVAAVAPRHLVFQIWVLLYMFCGTCSLFGDLVSSRSIDPGALVIPVSSQKTRS